MLNIAKYTKYCLKYGLVDRKKMEDVNKEEMKERFGLTEDAFKALKKEGTLCGS